MTMHAHIESNTPHRQAPWSTPQQGAELGRQLHARKKWRDALQVYDEAARRFPFAAIPILALAHDVFVDMPQNRFQLYVDRYFDFAIPRGARVLDIGSGHDPFPHATHLADRSLTDDHLGRAGAAFAHRQHLPAIECDVEDMSCFEDRFFDFVHCSHVLEHVRDPARACRELIRVGKRGYIETPTRGKDLFLNTTKASNHRWAVEHVHGVLTFVEYTEEEIEGFDCDILMRMHCAPQSIREKAFSALILLRAHLVNTMVTWEHDFAWEARYADGTVERSSDTRVQAVPLREVPTDDDAAPAANPNTRAFYDALYDGRYVMGELRVDWDYEAGDRMDWYRRVVALPFFADSGRYLDVGCGLGGLFAVLPTLPNVERMLFGIDFSEVAIAKCRQRSDGHFTVGRVEALPYPDDYFDRISCTETLEHVDDPNAVLLAMAQKLAPGGKLLITVPEQTLDLPDHEWPGGVSLHIQSFTIASLCQAVALAGLFTESATIDDREIWLVATKRT